MGGSATKEVVREKVVTEYIPQCTTDEHQKAVLLD